MEAIELILPAKEATITGGLHVKRAIPQRQRRMAGPFVFVDQMGPARPTQEIAVLPHPHIGLSTLTYLFEGEGLHRDSLGVVQPILPGEVNWMTAGRGIVHSERLKAGPTGRMFGIQTWVALPRAQEECEPSFRHYDASAVPVVQDGPVTTKVIAGSLVGATSQVETSSPLFYAEMTLEAGAMTSLAPEYEERAVYVVEGAIEAQGTALQAGDMAFFAPKRHVSLRADTASRLLLLGGEPLDGPRHISWNFVSSSRERLTQAADDWRNLRFPRVPGETSYIPLPRDGSEPVNYP